MIEYNITAYSGLASSTSQFSLLLVLLIIVGVSLAAFSLPYFKRLYGLIKAIGMSFLYFVIGSSVLLMGAGLYYAFRFLEKATANIPPIYYLYAIGGYLGISGLGYASTIIFKKIQKNYKTIRKEVKK